MMDYFVLVNLRPIGFVQMCSRIGFLSSSSCSSTSGDTFIVGLGDGTYKLPPADVEGGGL